LLLTRKIQRWVFISCVNLHLAPLRNLLFDWFTFNFNH
jgi:hypothetical protein